MKIITYTILALTCALPGLAFSGDWNYCPPEESTACCPTGYIFAYGGVFSDVTVDGNEPVFPSNEIVDMDSGYIAGGGAGIYSCFLGGTRFELEGLWAQNDIGRIQSDIFDGRGFVNFGFRGQLGTRALMANMLKEIPLCEGITGFVGGGVGVAQTDITVYEPFENRGFARGVSESDVSLAYQFIAGVDLSVTQCLAIFLQYKALGISATEYENLDFNIDSFFTHNLVFGARLSF